MRSVVFMGSMLVTMTLVGCWSSGPQMESRSTVATEGQVLLSGKPQAGIHVTLIPVDAKQDGKPRGITDAQGNFQLSTYRKDDGAPPGDYVITLTWPGAPDPSVPEDSQIPPDRLRGKFADPKKSAIKAKVESAKTILPPIKITHNPAEDE